MWFTVELKKAVSYRWFFLSGLPSSNWKCSSQKYTHKLWAVSKFFQATVRILYVVPINIPHAIGPLPVMSPASPVTQFVWVERQTSWTHTHTHTIANYLSSEFSLGSKSILHEKSWNFKHSVIRENQTNIKEQDFIGAGRLHRLRK